MKMVHLLFAKARSKFYPHERQKWIEVDNHDDLAIARKTLRNPLSKCYFHALQICQSF